MVTGKRFETRRPRPISRCCQSTLLPPLGKDTTILTQHGR